MTVLVRSRAGLARLAGTGRVTHTGGPAVALKIADGHSVRVLALNGQRVATGGELVGDVAEHDAAQLVARGIAEPAC